ncbi:MAG: hypothetical protein CMK59_11385 [Proteobacteria bacterium]|nr:hypothetical protein [Pseudomonadota bacterium]
MRPVYKTILKIREREKKERQIAFAEAEAERLRQEKELEAQKARLLEEQKKEHDTAGMVALSDLLNFQRVIEIKSSETGLKKQEEVTEESRLEMLEAQLEFRVMEEVIASMEEKEAKEIARKQEQQQDEIGIQLWRRRQDEDE